MPGPSEQEFDVAMVELKQAIADAAQRVIDKVNAIIAAQPDLTDELTDVRNDIQALAQIAPPEAPPS